MPSPLSLETIVSRLESQIVFHREREVFHAGQERIHHDQKALHAAELEALTQNLEAFKAVAATSVDLASRPGPPTAAPSPPKDPDANLDLSLIQMVTRVAEAHGPEEAFGTAAVTAELNRRYQDRLRKPVKERLVSVNLRRMLDAGQLRSIRKGRPHHEALYAKP